MDLPPPWNPQTNRVKSRIVEGLKLSQKGHANNFGHPQFVSTGVVAKGTPSKTSGIVAWFKIKLQSKKYQAKTKSQHFIEPELINSAMFCQVL